MSLYKRGWHDARRLNDTGVSSCFHLQWGNPCLRSQARSSHTIRCSIHVTVLMHTHIKDTHGMLLWPNKSYTNSTRNWMHIEATWWIVLSCQTKWSQTFYSFTFHVCISCHIFTPQDTFPSCSPSYLWELIIWHKQSNEFSYFIMLLLLDNCCLLGVHGFSEQGQMSCITFSAYRLWFNAHFDYTWQCATCVLHVWYTCNTCVVYNT